MTTTKARPSAVTVLAWLLALAGLTGAAVLTGPWLVELFVSLWRSVSA